MTLSISQAFILFSFDTIRLKQMEQHKSKATKPMSLLALRVEEILLDQFLQHHLTLRTEMWHVLLLY